jgi:hypothetical protein
MRNDTGIPNFKPKKPDLSRQIEPLEWLRLFNRGFTEKENAEGERKVTSEECRRGGSETRPRVFPSFAIGVIIEKWVLVVRRDMKGKRQAV